MNLSLAMSTQGVETECPPPPRIFARLFDAFETAGLGWCCWKSARRLADAFAGRGDLDLLIDRCDRRPTVAMLTRCGFKHAPDAPGRDDPAMMSFLGFDEVSGALLHVHVHFRLILGPPLFKNSRLPCEQAFLSRSRLLSGCNLRVLAVEDAALLLFVRVILEFSPFDPVQVRRRAQIEDKFRKDFLELTPHVDAARLRLAAAGIFDADIADRIALAVTSGDTMAPPYDLRWKITRALSQYRLCGDVEAGFRRAARTAKFLFGAFNRRILHLPRIWGRRAPGGGVVIAFVGVDGSGKSTATTNILSWLGPEIDVLKVYFGTGDGAPSLVLAPFKALAKLVARFIKTKPKGASHGQISDRPPGPIYSLLFAVWAVAVALDKRHKLILIQRAARRGFIVVTDRYPQDEIERFNDGPLLHRLAWTPDWLRRFEASIYLRARRAPPDLVVKLHVGVDAVLRREPDMSPALIEDRLDCLKQLHFAGSKAVSIDATAPLETVTRAIKRAVWDIL